MGPGAVLLPLPLRPPPPPTVQAHRVEEQWFNWYSRLRQEKVHQLDWWNRVRLEDDTGRRYVTRVLDWAHLTGVLPPSQTAGYPLHFEPPPDARPRYPAGAPRWFRLLLPGEEFGRDGEVEIRFHTPRP
jgi:hypothetical protein